MQLHFMSGGARTVEAVGEYNQERTHFNHDICVTAKGYEYYCYGECMLLFFDAGLFLKKVKIYQ